MSEVWNGLLRLLGGTLAFLYGLIPNFGIAIILLTVIISTLLFPLTLKQTRSMRQMQEIQPQVKSLQAKFKGDRERLNQELMALYKERGGEATAEALAYGWEHWDRIAGMENPAGYLYRVGRSRSRRKRMPVVFEPVPAGLPDVEPGLPSALGCLTEKQRMAVVLVHAYGWSRRETASMLEVSVSTLDTHLHRGLARLPQELGVGSHA